MAWRVAGEIGMERSLRPLPKTVVWRCLRSTWWIFRSHNSVERTPVSTRSRMMARLRAAWGTEWAEARLPGREERGVVARLGGMARISSRGEGERGRVSGLG